MNRQKPWVMERAFYLALGVLLLAYLIWGATHLGGFQWDDDEGINVIKARLVEAGFRLYRDIWSDQPPLLTWILSAAFRVFGRRVETGRFLILLFACCGLLGVALIAKRVSAPAAVLVATCLLAIDPQYLVYSRAIMVGLPAMALAVCALLIGWDTCTPWRLLLAGALFGGSLLIKPITAYQAVILAAATALPYVRRGPVDWRQVLRNWLWLAMGGGAAVLPVVGMTGADFVSQVVGTYAQTKAAYPFNLATNLSWIGQCLVDNVGLFVLAAWGVLVWVRTRRVDLGILVLWLGLTLLVLLTHTPLRGHQFLLLLFPAGILAAPGIEDLRRIIADARVPHRWIAFLPVLVTLGWLLVALHENDVLLIAKDDDNDNWLAVEALCSAVAPDELVVTDAPMLAFRADRLVPASLAVPSLRRLRTGGLSEDFLINQTAAEEPRAIVLWDGRFDLLPDYVEWVEQHYELARSYHGGRQRIYLSVGDPQYPQEVDFGGEIRLLGYRLNAPRVEPPSSLYVTLYWQAIGQPKVIYNGFVHLLGQERQLLSQRDLIMGTWSNLTVAWEPGEVVIEHYDLDVPEGTPSGPWPLEVGVYEYQSNRRLPVLDADGRSAGVSSVLLDLQPVVRWPARMASSQHDYSTDAQFGQVARLLGHDLQPSLLAPGEAGQLLLHWEALSSVWDDYTVFVHILGPDGDLVTQADSPPCGGRCPTYGWVPGEHLADQHAFALPTGATRGPHRIAVGLYDLASGERLPCRDGQGRSLPENQVLLEGLEVER
jgi:hypothetical protein